MLGDKGEVGLARIRGADIKEYGARLCKERCYDWVTWKREIVIVGADGYLKLAVTF